MTLASFLVYLPAVLIGSLSIHLIWPERRALALLLKLSLGTGAGLGLSSMLYFVSLLIAPGQINVLAVQGILLIVLLCVTFLRERREKWNAPGLPGLSGLQWSLLGLAFIALIFTALVFFNLTLARPQGAFDAWSIWNRAARFIYRDPQNWRATLSPDLYWGNHADYPLLVPLNVAWGWEALGTETPRVPMAQSSLFLFACIGLMFASVGLQRTLGQASLASLVLMSTPIFLSMGAGLISDIPVTYFIFAGSVLTYLYFVFKQPALLILSGFMGGLAAWTKNEGLLFVVVSVPALILVSRRHMFTPLASYLIGLAIPMTVVLYFKIALAPVNDLFVPGGGDMLAKITDLSRYWIILKALQEQATGFAGWPFSIFIQLAIYAFVMRLGLPIHSYQEIQAVGAILLLQLLGYCVIFLLTPHDLQWHLGTSLARLVLQVYPSGIFLFFCAFSAPEEILGNPLLPKETG